MHRTTLAALMAVLALSVSLANAGRCELPAVTGPCGASIPRWYYNPQEGRCKQFVYGGCGGNANSFMLEGACNSVCGADEDVATASNLAFEARMVACQTALEPFWSAGIASLKYEYSIIDEDLFNEKCESLHNQNINQTNVRNVCLFMDYPDADREPVEYIIFTFGQRMMRWMCGAEGRAKLRNVRRNSTCTGSAGLDNANNALRACNDKLLWQQGSRLNETARSDIMGCALNVIYTNCGRVHGDFFRSSYRYWTSGYGAFGNRRLNVS